MTREITNKTGNEKSVYRVNINNFKINLYKTLPKFKNYDKICKENKLRLLPNFYLPIVIEKTTFIEQEKSEKTYGKEELKNILISELEKQFEEDGVNELNVVNRVINIYNKEKDILEIQMTYEVIEDIGTEEKIDSPQ